MGYIVGSGKGMQVGREAGMHRRWMGGDVGERGYYVNRVNR